MSAVRSIIRLVIEPGSNEEFERAFLAAGMLERPKAIDPAFQGELLRAIDQPDTYMVVAHWSSPDAYANWQETSRNGADLDAMQVLDRVLVSAVPGQAFEVAATSPQD